MKSFRKGQEVEVTYQGQRYGAIYVSYDNIKKMHIVNTGHALRIMEDECIREIVEDKYQPQAGDIIYGTCNGKLQTFTIISADSTDWMVLDVFSVVREGQVIYTEDNVGIEKQELPKRNVRAPFKNHRAIRQGELAFIKHWDPDKTGWYIKSTTDEGRKYFGITCKNKISLGRKILENPEKGTTIEYAITKVVRNGRNVSRFIASNFTDQCYVEVL